MFASIVINVASSNVDQLYEYYVPQDMESFIKIGSRVNVAFGQGNRLVMGYVLDLYHEKRFDGDIKELNELLDFTPVITKDQLLIAEFLKDDTICPLIRILNLMIPSALQRKTFKYLILNNSILVDADLLELFKGEKMISYSNHLLPYATKIKKEIDKGNISINYETKEKVNYKYINKYSVNLEYYLNYLQELKNPIKKDFLTLYKDDMILSLDEIIDKYDISIFMIKDLVKKGYLKVQKERILRIKDNSVPFTFKNLKEQNKTVLDTVTRILEQDKPNLYIPSTVDEKNQVLLSLIDEELNNDKNVVILCADILSSVKYASLIRKTLNIEVACINSTISDGEYLDYYTLINENKYRVIVTTPKGIFLPYQNVGMYFMMNEESDNYYNDQSPRYDLHKTLYFISKTFNAKFIMESMSPSVSNYCYALKGVYEIIDNSLLKENSNTLVVNMTDELKEGNNTCISKPLFTLLKEKKIKNRQSLLIVNNKSFSKYVLCPACGNVEKCPYCEISLNYNEKLNKLICPACGYKESFNHSCPKCGSKYLRYGGVGIESVKSTIDKVLPDAKTIVIDNVKFDEFSYNMGLLEDNDVDIIITTKTYSDSLVDDYIDLVGIIDFDSTLKTPSYDALSRGYNLLKACGSHLNNKNGTLLVQTTDPTSSPLENYILGDYKEFMKSEIKARKLMHNEPFYHINRIIIKAPYEETFKVASNIKNTLKSLCGNRLFIIGPTYNKQYMGTVLIVKHNYVKINEIYKKIYEYYQTTSVMIIFDKYPRKIS